MGTCFSIENHIYRLVNNLLIFVQSLCGGLVHWVLSLSKKLLFLVCAQTSENWMFINHPCVCKMHKGWISPLTMSLRDSADSLLCAVPFVTMYVIMHLAYILGSLLWFIFYRPILSLVLYFKYILGFIILCFELQVVISLF